MNRVFLLIRRTSIAGAFLAIAVLLLPFLLSSCASPAKGRSSDAWAYKAYPGPKKDYRELSNVILRTHSNKSFTFRDGYGHSEKKYTAWEDIITGIDGDDGSKFSSWNGLWGGNDSNLGYLKMWIEPGEHLVAARIFVGLPIGKVIAFFYEFKPGVEYKLVCDVTMLGKEDTDESGESTTMELDGKKYRKFDAVSHDCYFYWKPHDAKAYNVNNRDHLLNIREKY